MSQKLLRINEIFHSIQGESSKSGLPCVFVRLQGCSLRCHYCDTSYAFTQGFTMEIEEIIGIIQAYDCALVEITGGEPLLQPSVHSLMQKLCDLDFEVLLETSGHHSLAPCDSRVKRIVDVKTPSSGAQESFLETNYDYLCATDEVKFVIADREDFDWALSIVREHKLVHRVANVHFSPVMFQEGNDYIQGCEALPPVILAEWILDAGEPVRLQMQLHRYIWAPDARGV